MNRRSRRQVRTAFTLMEVLLVLVILVVLGSLAVGMFTGTQKKALERTAQVQVDSYDHAAQRYQIEMFSFPPSLQDLRVNPSGSPNWSGPYIDKDVPADPWGNPYQYDPQGPRHNNEKPDIWSYGPDGSPGTQDDIYNK
ncbi:MAG: type II secretion system major pseudopilin GspG [Pirellulales bacterium]|nr:type II secretion system major pseudopilin GspG [Pirellulales bacterium]